MLGIKYKFRYCIFIIAIFLSLFPSFNSFAGSNCILSTDTGVNYSTIINANGDLSSGSGTYGEQQISWTDTGLYTSGGSDGFLIKIQGKWRPWNYGSANDLINSSNYDVLLKGYFREYYCTMFAKNINSDEQHARLGQLNGESNYIGNDYKNVILDSNGYITRKVKMDTLFQDPCWVTAGYGLYISFWGNSGKDNPEIATQLNTADIECPNAYAIDYNHDSIIEVNECLEKTSDGREKNKAYYTQGLAECEPDYYHGASQLDRINNKIGIYDCYSEDNKGIKTDQTTFLYSAISFPVDTKGTPVGAKQKVKLGIYDTYYQDNIGAYKVTFLSGVSEDGDKGLLEKIVSDLEKVFVGSRNSDGNIEGGVLYYFYNLIVFDSTFAWVVRLLLVLYISFLGLSFMIGIVPLHERKQYMGILFKISFIIAMTTSTSWKLYDAYFVRFFIDGFASVIKMVLTIVLKTFGNEGQGLAYVPTQVNNGSFSSAYLFYFVDILIKNFFNSTITDKIWSLFLHDFLGLAKIVALYYVIIYFIFSVIDLSFPYIIMFIQVVLALSVGPIFILLLLFEKTKYIFKNWITFLGGRLLNMLFLFVLLFGFAGVISSQFARLLKFGACEYFLWDWLNISECNNNCGMIINPKVWIANFPDSYEFSNSVNFIIELFFIWALIKIFIQLVKKVPAIVDSIVVIDETEAGFIPPLNASRVGSPFSNPDASPSTYIGGTFSEALNTIKVKGKNGKDEGIFHFARRNLISVANPYNWVNSAWKKAKNGRTIKESTIKTAKNFGRSAVNYVKDGAAKVAEFTTGSYLFERESTKAISSVSLYNARLSLDNKLDNKNGELIGAKAVDYAVKDYKERMSAKGMSGNILDKEVSSFRKRAEDEFIYKPMKNKMNELMDKVSDFEANNSISLSRDTFEKGFRDSFYDYAKRLGITDENGNYDKFSINVFLGLSEKYQRNVDSRLSSTLNFDKYMTSQDNLDKLTGEKVNKITDALDVGMINKDIDNLKPIISSLSENMKSLHDNLEKLKQFTESYVYDPNKVDDDQKTFKDLKDKINDLNKSLEEDATKLSRYNELNELGMLKNELSDDTSNNKNPVNVLPSGLTAESIGLEGMAADLGLASGSIQDMLGFGEGAANVVPQINNGPADSTETADSKKNEALEKLKEIEDKIEKQQKQMEEYEKAVKDENKKKDDSQS